MRHAPWCWSRRAIAWQWAARSRGPEAARRASRPRGARRRSQPRAGGRRPGACQRSSRARYGPHRCAPYWPDEWCHCRDSRWSRRSHVTAWCHRPAWWHARYTRPRPAMKLPRRTWQACRLQEEISPSIRQQVSHLWGWFQACSASIGDTDNGEAPVDALNCMITYPLLPAVSDRVLEAGRHRCHSCHATHWPAAHMSHSRSCSHILLSSRTPMSITRCWLGRKHLTAVNDCSTFDRGSHFLHLPNSLQRLLRSVVNETRNCPLKTRIIGDLQPHSLAVLVRAGKSALSPRPLPSHAPPCENMQHC